MKNTTKNTKSTKPSSHTKETFIKLFLKTGLTPEERLLKAIFGKEKPAADIKPTPIKFRTMKNAELLWEESEKFIRFHDDLENPKKVAEMLEEFQKWRLGHGKYAPNDDPKKNVACPFTPKQVTNITEAAILFLKGIKA